MIKMRPARGGNESGLRQWMMKSLAETGSDRYDNSQSALRSDARTIERVKGIKESEEEATIR